MDETEPLRGKELDLLARCSLVGMPNDRTMSRLRVTLDRVLGLPDSEYRSRVIAIAEMYGIG